jgi:hypothetical protein
LQTQVFEKSVSSCLDFCSCNTGIAKRVSSSLNFCSCNALTQKVREHGHDSFFAIKKTSGKLHDLLKDYHMFTVAEAIDSYDKRVHPTITGDYSYEEIEHDYFELSRLVVESLLSE